MSFYLKFKSSRDSSVVPFQSEMKLYLVVYLSSILLVEFARSQIIFYQCFPDTPQKCDEDSHGLEWPNTKMRLLLYTRKTQDEPERLHMCNGTLPRNSRFNPKNPLVVIIPGFIFGTCEIESLPEMKDELLKKGDMNVILIINAEEYGNDFLNAMGKVESIARTIAQVLQDIQIRTGIKNKNVYLIGHSLGAHVAGLIGQIFPVRRITALDPGGVLYRKDIPIDKRLDPGDADLVDVIHTNGGTGLPFLGAYFPLGHADFYVNGGSNQPSCSESIWRAFKNFNFLFVLGVSSVPSFCAHEKSIEYYTQSINNGGKFIAYACNSYSAFQAGNCTGEGSSNVTMGYGFDTSFTPEQRSKEFPRKFYLDTKDY